MSPEQGYFTYECVDGEQEGVRARIASDAQRALGGDLSEGIAQGESVQGGSAGKARVAAFDFDGTSMDGNSPVRLVLYLIKKRMLPNVVALRIGLWALRYKLRLPQNEAWVRGMVFTAFEGKPVAEVNRFLSDFYDEDIASRFRPLADEAMKRHRQAGDVVLMVSATFEPIIERMMQFHPVDGQVSTRMRIAPNGTYTRRVEGKPVEGTEKLVAIERWCNERFGAGNWELAYAYGDHHSDRPMLEAAEHPFAVDPDNPLMRTAKAKGWPVLDW